MINFILVLTICIYFFILHVYYDGNNYYDMLCCTYLGKNMCVYIRYWNKREHSSWVNNVALTISEQHLYTCITVLQRIFSMV